MSLFRHPSASGGMNSYNECDNVLYMLAEEHRKPNIIRGSGTKAKALHPILEQDSHKSLESSAEHNIVFTNAEVSSTDSMISTFAQHIQNLEEDQLPNSLQNVMGSSNDLQTFQELVLPKSEQQMSLDIDEEELVEAAIQTPDGNYIVLMKGDEIISAHPMDESDQATQNTESEIEELSELSCSDNMPTQLQIEQVDADDHALTVSQSDIQESYVLYQLPDGGTILVQGGFAEGHQIIMNGNEEIMQLLPESHAQSQSLALVTNKPRKRYNTEHQTKGPSPPKKTYNSMKKAKNSCTTTSLLPSVANQMNSNSVLMQQHQQQIGNSNFALSGMIKEESPIFEQAPQVEVKGKPFRFDVPESEANEFVGDNFLSLVIENFQTQIESHSADEDKKPDISTLTDPNTAKTEVKIEKEDPVLIPSTESCPQCSFKTVDRKSLSQHISRFHNDEHLFPCTQCDKKFPYDFQLTNHYKIHHGILQYQTSSCDSCGKQFTIDGAMSIHKKTCTGVKKELSKESVLPDIDLGIVVEEEPATSSKSFNRRKQTVYSRDKEFPCEEDSCYKWFSDKFALLRHQINVHLTKSPFLCSMCEKYFENKEALLSHIACHEDGIARPYECQKCQKGFKMESHLIGHMRAHIQKDSTNNAKSREQELLNHPEKLMQLVKISFRNKTNKASEGLISEVFCQICDDIFPNQQALDQHKMYKHKVDLPNSLLDEGVLKQCKADPEQSVCGTEEVNNRVFVSITDWRRHSELHCVEPAGAPLLIGGRPYRKVADVQNDFKNLCSKILEETKDTCNEIVMEDDVKRIASNFTSDADGVKENGRKSKSAASSRFKTSERKVAQVGTTSSASVKTLEKVEQTLSTASISSIVSQMRSNMVTRAGIKSLPKTSTTDKSVNKRKKLLKDPGDKKLPEKTLNRDLRIRNSKSSSSNQLNEIKVNKSDSQTDNPVVNNPESDSISAVDEVGKSFVSIFKNVGQKGGELPEPSNAPHKLRTRTRKQ